LLLLLLDLTAASVAVASAVFRLIAAVSAVSPILCSTCARPADRRGGAQRGYQPPFHGSLHAFTRPYEQNLNAPN
jgi:hypothetical protein